MLIRELQPDEWNQLSSLIFHSTNEWYDKNLNRACFPGDDPAICRIFPEIYDDLDPGCCLVAVIEGEIAGSCFYHPRETHFSLGIMNADPKFSGRGVARALLNEIIRKAGEKPIRLVSSALNLDSYSLYTKAGFCPLAIYQDMFLPEGMSLPPVSDHVRPATISDLPEIMRIEEEVSGIRREKDWRYFLDDTTGTWRGLVYESAGKVTGFLFAIDHPDSAMLGPGVMRDDEAAYDLITAQLSSFKKHGPIFLVPAKESGLIQRLYELGGRNCEIHFSQVLGHAQEPAGIVMPTFMPETG